MMASSQVCREGASRSETSAFGRVVVVVESLSVFFLIAGVSVLRSSVFPSFSV